ncbi:hypothetical protein B1218_35420, partial [Pseudomonas ogarae]
SILAVMLMHFIRPFGHSLFIDFCFIAALSSVAVICLYFVVCTKFAACHWLCSLIGTWSVRVAALFFSSFLPRP